MRSLIVMAMLVASLAHSAWNGYTESRDLEITANGVELLQIDAGAGEIVIRGDAQAANIKVRAVIRVDDSEADARAMIAKGLVLSLETKRGTAKLQSYFDDHFWRTHDAVVDLEVRVPQGLALFVDDGSGAIHIEDVFGDVRIDDGSGPINVSHAIDVSIDDGSGSITISSASGDVWIDDGSGDINIRDVEGSVTIDGGSGSVQLADIRGAIYQSD
jgi:DUF4097 and DUF4098 domain-containing protein YvlB